MDTPPSTLSYLLVFIYGEHQKTSMELHQKGFSIYEFRAFSGYMDRVIYCQLIIHYQLRARNAVGEGNSWLEGLCQAHP